MPDPTWPVGIVGAGRFAAFRLRAYLGVPGVAVVVSTPPFLHAPQALAAARAECHVLVEKPLTPAQGEAMQDQVRAAGTVLTVNHVLRFDPHHRLVTQMVRDGVLRPLEHVHLTNLAAGDELPPDHRAWDPARGGGIHVEHGRHFFDLVGLWAGEPVRSEGGIEHGPRGRPDAAWTAVVYKGGTMDSFYHSFRRPREAERTTLDLQFARGRIRVTGWGSPPSSTWRRRRTGRAARCCGSSSEAASRGSDPSEPGSRRRADRASTAEQWPRCWRTSR